MGTFLFLCLKAARAYETPYDWAVLCGLLALEVPAYGRLWLYWRATR